MSKVIFFNLPGASGHINPTIGVVSELIQRGHEVIYYADESSRSRFEALGAKYRTYEKWFDYTHNTEAGTDILRMANAEFEMMDACISPLLEEIKRDNPDCIVYDPCCIWGKYIGESMKIPTISSITTVVSSPWLLLSEPSLAMHIIKTIVFGAREIWGFRERFLSLSKALDVKYRGLPYHVFDFFACEGDLNMIFNTPEYQPYPNKLAPTFQFYGASIDDKRDIAEFDDSFRIHDTFVYVSLGTLHNDNQSFYSKILYAFRDTNIDVLISIGQTFDISKLGKVPGNFTIRRFVPQLEVLKTADLFITHGGMNSMNEAAWFGVPVLVVPQQFEQEFNGKRFAKMKIGKLLCDADDSATIKKDAFSILEDSGYKINMAAYGERMRLFGGYRRAVNDIELIITDASELHEKLRLSPAA